MKNEKKSSNSFRGIEFVIVDDLPTEQKKSLLNWVNPDDLIKISTSDKLYENCIQYSMYSKWFENIFQAELERTESVSHQKMQPIKLRPAF